MKNEMESWTTYLFLSSSYKMKLKQVKQWGEKNDEKWDGELNHLFDFVLETKTNKGFSSQMKTNKWFSFPSHFSSFNSCLSVVLLLDKGDYPENSHVVFCPNK